MRLKVLGSAEDALRAMTEQLIEKMNMRGISPFHLALSGAGTAQQMFGLWIREYREKIKWEQLRFYWVDERCVSPDDEESNFKHADELLFRPLDIPHAHVHRIHGEREPEVIQPVTVIVSIRIRSMMVSEPTGNESLLMGVS